MKLLRNLTISKKLTLLIFVSAVGLGSVGTVGINYIRDIAQNSEEMYAHNLIPLNTVMQIRVNARASDAYTLELLTSKDPARNQELVDEITSAWDEIDAMIEELAGSDLMDEEIALLTQYREHAANLKEARNQVIALAADNKNAEAYAHYREDVEAMRKLVNDTLKALQKVNVENAGTINETNQQDVKDVTVFVTSVVIAALLALVALSLVIARMIVKPVKEVKLLLTEAEQGDFTVKGSYISKDEIGELVASFNSMTANLQTAFGTVHESTFQVAAAAEELSASAEQSSKASEHVTLSVQELAVGTEKQAKLVADSTKAISDMAGYTQSIADSTDRMKQEAMHASAVSSEGNQAIGEVNAQMNSIYANVNSLFDAVKSLDERSNEIEQITNVISGISAQTNLLALNAAIEAARAGEHGKGFAVVAGEVRKLAEQSNKSTDQISQLIHLIQQDTETTLRTMEKAAQEVNSGLAVVNHAGGSFLKIEQAVSSVVAQIEEISGALRKLAGGTANVNDSIRDVHAVASDSASMTQNISAATEEQLASMEEISSSSQALAGLADDLQRIIKQFKI
ncbi:methyl-accepting chemotaxis protein [Paenibacillus methanolicus]|uniref:Methyl-accepting chemotaxis protein n=1 Tax=Paenibacillus methanolicus TaxID=582686 RepID=A0A5S5CDP2_9BACL|nr:methyl-accepting chemotaxis protein [Paenibacillus methanolicus]TYP76436.1 methyl-accepting chemotaxis protein [Paenibacillus methanolicus]